MCELVEALKRNILPECHARRCRKERCSVPLHDAPSPHLVVNMDCSELDIPADSRRCDFLFVGCERTRGAGWVVPLELKSGSPNTADVVEQLQGGARFAEAQLPTQHETRFLPVAVYGGKLHRAESERLKKPPNQVSFRGKKYKVKLMRCNTPLKDALSTFRAGL